MVEDKLQQVLELVLQGGSPAHDVGGLSHCYRRKSEICGRKLCSGGRSRSRSSSYRPCSTPFKLRPTTGSSLTSPKENKTSMQLCVNYIIVGTQKECI